MKRSGVGAWFAIFIFALIAMGCASAPLPESAPKPTLPIEIMFLSMELGEPEIMEAYAIVVRWTVNGVPYDLVLVYDPILGVWYAYPYGMDGELPAPTAVNREGNYGG